MDASNVLAGIDAGTSLIGTGYNLFNSIMDRRYNKWLQQKQWEREDTAYQRAAADLEAAGLSKTLAAGAGASSSSDPISTQQVDTSTDLQAKYALSLQNKGTQANIAYTDAQTALLDAQRRHQELENEWYETQMQDKHDVSQAQIEHFIHQNDLTDAQAREANYAFNYANANGLALNESTNFSIFMALLTKFFTEDLPSVPSLGDGYKKNIDAGMNSADAFIGALEDTGSRLSANGQRKAQELVYGYYYSGNDMTRALDERTDDQYHISRGDIAGTNWDLGDVFQYENSYSYYMDKGGTRAH